MYIKARHVGDSPELAKSEKCALINVWRFIGPVSSFLKETPHMSLIETLIIKPSSPTELREASPFIHYECSAVLVLNLLQVTVKKHGTRKFSMYFNYSLFCHFHVSYNCARCIGEELMSLYM